MRALTIRPGVANSTELSDVPEPAAQDGAVLVGTLAIGVCGTDREIVSGSYGEAPPGNERLVLGHESVGRVLEAPAGQNRVGQHGVTGASALGELARAHRVAHELVEPGLLDVIRWRRPLLGAAQVAVEAVNRSYPTALVEDPDFDVWIRKRAEEPAPDFGALDLDWPADSPVDFVSTPDPR